MRCCLLLLGFGAPHQSCVGQDKLHPSIIVAVQVHITLAHLFNSNQQQAS